MSEQKSRMVAGELYRPGDPELVKDRATAQRFMRVYNATTVEDGECRRPLLAAHLGGVGDLIVTDIRRRIKKRTLTSAGAPEVARLSLAFVLL